VRPLVAIVGGAKVSTKIPVIESLLDKCDSVLVGGGMIFTFYKALGYDVGASMVEEDMIATAKMLMEKAEAKGVKVSAKKALVHRVRPRRLQGGVRGQVRKCDLAGCRGG
jgi:phosphoglycerate kinase